jgi:hypothetical protein
MATRILYFFLINEMYTFKKFATKFEIDVRCQGIRFVLHAKVEDMSLSHDPSKGCRYWHILFVHVINLYSIMWEDKQTIESPWSASSLHHVFLSDLSIVGGNIYIYIYILSHICYMRLFNVKFLRNIIVYKVENGQALHLQFNSI